MNTFEKFIATEKERLEETVCAFICEQDKCPLGTKIIASCNECMVKVANNIYINNTIR